MAHTTGMKSMPASVSTYSSRVRFPGSRYGRRAIADRPAGYNADPGDKSTMSVRDNFTGFWNLWKYRIVKRDYALLDEIHPNRTRSAEEWFRNQDQRARELGKGSLWDSVQPQNRSPVLKAGEDMRIGKL
jgi:hypothetical protein